MTFRDLHDGALPLLLPNAWDVASALAFAEAGFHAIGTTSFGVAASGVIASGPIISLMDMATSLAVWVKLGRFRPQATLDMRVDYMRPAVPGRTIIGRGECYSLTRSVGFVREEEIERTRATDLEDVLQDTPGVLVRSRGVGEEPRISIRGSGLRNNFHTRGVNVLLDGFPFQNADGMSDVESFEMLATKRIEVYKGANSLRMGGGALGGAINLVTRTADDSPPGFPFCA